MPEIPHDLNLREQRRKGNKSKVCSDLLWIISIAPPFSDFGNVGFSKPWFNEAKVD